MRGGLKEKLEYPRRAKPKAGRPDPRAVVTKQLPNIRCGNFLTIQYSLYRLPSLVPLFDGIRTRRDGAAGHVKVIPGKLLRRVKS